MEHFGYERMVIAEKLAAWEGPDFELLLYQAAPELRARCHELYQPGFHHLALRVAKRAEVDRVFRWLLATRADILDAPREYPQYSESYYAVFFRDPDGLKLEVLSL
jgi:catechol 2,3-dioxygenase-like lactoylglutathione lyase family enzyme